MRVLKVSDVYWPRVNGVSTAIATLRREMHARGDEVTLIAPDYGQGAEAGILRLPARAVPLDREDRRMRYRDALALAPQLRAHGYDLVHIHTPFVAYYAGRALAERLGVPCVLSYHTWFEEYLHHYLPWMPRAPLRAAARVFSRSQCNAVDAVVVPSQAVHELLTGYGVTTPLHPVPTGIPMSVTGPDARAEFRQRLRISPQRPVLLYVGRLAFEKNIEFLLKVTVQARTQVPELLLLLSGEGPAQPSLERQVRRLGLHDQVRFLGYLSRESELPRAYAAADLFVFASRTETQGLVLLEAMTQGLPVVALAARGTCEVLVSGQGCVTPPAEPAAFAAEVVALLRDPARRDALGQRGQQYAATWSAAALTDRLRGVYQGIVEGMVGEPARSAQASRDDGPALSL